jgi:hypothetical protein
MILTESPRSGSAIVAIALACLFALVFGGCASLGAVPHYVPPADMTARTEPLRPSYTDVKLLAYAQLQGYLVSGRINRDSLYAGALVAGASVAAMTALAVFAPGSSALVGIPLGAGFLGGTAAVMQNDPKAVIYLRAALRVQDAVLNSDKRLVRGPGGQDEEALCLREDLHVIDGLVTEHLMLLVPKNVAERLKAIGPGNPDALVALAKKANDYDDLLEVPSACPVPIPMR